MKKVSLILGLTALCLCLAAPAFADNCNCPQQIVSPQVQQVIAQPAQVQYQIVQPQVQRVIVQPQYAQQVVAQQRIVVQQPLVQRVVVQPAIVRGAGVNVNVNRGLLGLRSNVNVQVR